MTSPAVPLLRAQMRAWISAKGFWLVVFAALSPLLLTSAWVVTHRADLDATLDVAPRTVYTEGDLVTLTGTIDRLGRANAGASNATIVVGALRGNAIVPDADASERIESYPATTTLEWTATPGIRFVVVQADVADEVAEIDEYNNQAAIPVFVKRRVPAATEAPPAPSTVAGAENANTTFDATVTLGAIPALDPSAPALFTATITNTGATDIREANATLRLVQAFGTTFVPLATQTENLTLAPGATHELTLAWSAREGTYWLEAYLDAPNDARDDTPETNHATAPVVIDPVFPADLELPAPPERLTVKEFYVDVLSLLHLRVLLPLVALFYAAGVITDERDQGALRYLLTRPLSRGLMPITKFVAGYVVGALAVVVGILATYALLFGTTPQGSDLGFLTTPLLASLLVLFAYGGVFTLVGTWFDRPGIVGIALILGWENVAPLFVPWLANFTLAHHVGNALAAWPIDQGVTWLPEGEGLRAAGLLLAIGVGGLVAATAAMKRREFDL